MESVAGSVQKDIDDISPEKPKNDATPGETPGGPTPTGAASQFSIFGGLRKALGYKVPETTPGAPTEPLIEVPVWEEFPWKKYLVEEDIIVKWKAVDMKVIHNLHSNFDIDKGEFTNI